MLARIVARSLRCEDATGSLTLRAGHFIAGITGAHAHSKSNQAGQGNSGQIWPDVGILPQGLATPHFVGMMRAALGFLAECSVRPWCAHS